MLTARDRQSIYARTYTQIALSPYGNLLKPLPGSLAFFNKWGTKLERAPPAIRCEWRFFLISILRLH